MIRTMIRVSRLTAWKWYCLNCLKVFPVPPADRCPLCNKRDFDILCEERS